MMIQARDEEVQIQWACSAQNSELLPESVKKRSKQSERSAKKKAAIAHIQGKFKQP